MKKVFKRSLQVALTTFVTTATMGVFATGASASENTWIKGNDLCITTQGGSGIVSDVCRSGDRTQLWDRAGSQIKKAYTNQCLDSDRNGNVYYQECNGGNFQNWDYEDAGSGLVRVKDRETGRYLVAVGVNVSTQPSASQASYWQFYGGE
ncbi:RICIN domain-containing protein [Streptomyces fuscichromogenes]|uniref:RICIN domain-containing protein n=1 Tax=Streptomyces fuscichromogenes TaxID=1324013 RepID=UPI0038178670